MILPCEIGVKTILPAVKAIMARQIVEKHGLNEQEAAKILGLSQSAVSRYISKERGNLLSLEQSADIVLLIDQMVISLIKEPANKAQILSLFCQICQAIRQRGLMCAACQKERNKDWSDTCIVCR